MDASSAGPFDENLDLDNFFLSSSSSVASAVTVVYAPTILPRSHLVSHQPSSQHSLSNFHLNNISTRCHLAAFFMLVMPQALRALNNNPSYFVSSEDLKEVWVLKLCVKSSAVLSRRISRSPLPAAQIRCVCRFRLQQNGRPYLFGINQTPKQTSPTGVVDIRS